MKARKHLIEKTIEIFQPLYDHPLREEDALEIISSVTDYLEVLIGLDCNVDQLRKRGATLLKKVSI